MKDERVTLRGLADGWRTTRLLRDASADEALTVVASDLEALADAGHFIARRMRPEEVTPGEMCLIFYRHNDIPQPTYLIRRKSGAWYESPNMHIDEPWCGDEDIAYAIPLADLAPEGE